MQDSHSPTKRVPNFGEKFGALFVRHFVCQIRSAIVMWRASLKAQNPEKIKRKSDSKVTQRMLSVTFSHF